MRKKNKFCQIKEINGEGKVCPRLKYDDTLETVFETMKNSFFPEGKNGIAKLWDLIVVICSSRMIVVDDFKTTLEEYKDKNGNLKFILRTKQLTKIQMIERRTLLLVFQVTVKAILSNQRKRQKWYFHIKNFKEANILIVALFYFQCLIRSLVYKY